MTAVVESFQVTRTMRQSPLITAVFAVIRFETEYQRAAAQSDTTVNLQQLRNGASSEGIAATASLQMKRKREEGQKGALDGSVMELLTEDIAVAVPITSVGNECLFCNAPATYENPVFFWCGSENCKDLIQTAFDRCSFSITRNEFARKTLLKYAMARVKESTIQNA